MPYHDRGTWKGNNTIQFVLEAKRFFFAGACVF